MRLHPCLLVAVLLFLCILPAVAVDFPVPTGTWQESGTLATPRSFATATLLRDGRILILGGKDASGNALASAEVFRPDGTVASAPAMVTPRYGHSAVLLADGRVMVAGGHTTGGTIVNTAEIFDPSANTWSAVPNVMTDPRADFTMSALTGGDVIVIGGDNGAGTVESIDRFSLASGSFQFQAYLTAARKSHAASVLRDGRIVITGGVGQGGTIIPLSLTEIYDPVANSLTGGPALKMARFGHSSTTLVDGTVLIAGGGNGNADLASLEIFDPVANTMTTASATLATPRSGQVALMLPNNGSVLIAGGTSAGTALASSELYQSWNTAVLANGAMSAARQGAAASALLADGTALVAAGSNLGSTDLYGFATVKTDAADYAPGTPVNVIGSGWVPGETVTLSLLESPLFDTHPNMTAVADPQGNIANSDFAPDTHDVNIRFYLTATGSKSQAYNTFTDANPGTIQVVGSQSPNPVVAGNDATYGISITFGGSSTSCSVVTSISAPQGQVLPNGLSADPTTITGSKNQTVPGTLTIHTSTGGVTAAPGTYSFIVTGTKGTGCDSGPGSSSPVQIVIAAKTAPGNVLISSANPSIYGAAVKFTSTITGTSGLPVPGGIVTFMDGTTTLGTGTLSGTTPDTATFQTSSLTAGSHSIKAVYGGDSNYLTSTSAVLTQTVNQAAPTIAWTNPSAITYGTALSSTQLNATASYQNNGTSTTVPGTFTYTPAAGAVLAAGSQTLSVHFVPTDTTNFATPTDKTVSIDVSKLSLTPSITASNKPYDGTNSATFICSVAGVISADTGQGQVSCSGGTATFASVNVGTGITVTATGLTLTGSKADNYTLASTTATTTANITARQITVTAASDTKTYDGGTGSSGIPTVTTGTIAGTDTPAFTQTFDNRSVGTGKTLTPAGKVNDGNNGANYAVTFVPVSTGKIVARPLSVTATADTKVYDGTTSSTAVPTISAGTVASGEVPTFMQTFDNKNAGSGKTLTASATIKDSSNIDTSANYQITYVPSANGTINRRPLSVTAATDTKVYDGTTTSTVIPTITSGSLVAGDTASFTQTFESKNAGTRTLTATGSVTDGNQGQNYQLTFVTNSGSITPRTLTVTAATDSKTYDGTTASTATPTVTSGSLATGDSASFTQTFDSKNVGSRTLAAAGSVNDGNSGKNYTITFATAPGTISARPLTVTAATDSKTYDGTTTSTATPTITSGSLVSGDTASFTQTFDTKNAGSRTLIATGSVSDSNSGKNYVLSFVTTTGTISARPLTVTAATDTKTYDGTTTSTATPTITSGSLVSGDTASFTESFDSKNAGSRTMTAVGSVSDSNSGKNYVLSFVTATGTISARPLTVTAATDSKTYDGATTSTATPTITSGSLVSGDTASFTQTFDSKNAGSRTMIATGSVSDGNTGSNYVISFLTTTGTISARPLTVTATTDSKTYDGTTTSTATPTITSGSLVSGDTASFTESFDSKNAGSRTMTAVGSVSDSNSGKNYVLSFVTATGTISARPLTVTAATDSKTYDGTTTSTATPTITSGSLVSGDTASFTQSFDNKNALTGKTLTPIGNVSDGNAGANYQITFAVSHTGIITQRPLHVTATAVNKQYDGTSSATVTLTDDHLSGDSVTDSYTSAVFPDKNVGPGKIVTVSGISISGADAGNYAVASATATTTASITQRPLHVTATATDKQYDGNTTASVTLSDDRVSGDLLTVSDATASFDTKNVGPGKTVTVTGINISGTDANNYNLTNTAAITAASITARQLVVTATGVSRTYDGTTAATVTLADNRISGDTFTDAYTAAAFTDKNAGTAKIINVSGINISGADATNYIPNSTATATANITARPVTITAVADSKVYDATTTSTATPAISGDGLAAGDTASLSQSFDTKNAATGKALTAAGTIADGNGGNNYQVTFVQSHAGVITQRALHVTSTGVNKQYDGTPAATVTLSDDHISSDAVTDGYISAAFSDKNVGTGKTVTVTGISISGADALNYALASTSATTTASITQRALHVSATATDKQYDGTTTATVTLSDDRVSGDTLTDADTVATFSDKSVGAGKTVTVSGVSISGTDAGNYNLADTTATSTASITARQLVITATGVSRKYDGTTAETVTLADNRVSGDTFTDAYTTASFADKNVGIEKTINVGGINISGGDAANYIPNTTATATANITARPVTITAVADSKVYDATTTSTAAPAISGDGLAPGDTASLSEAFDNKNVGTGKTLTAAGTITDGNGGNNYQITFTASQTGMITQRAIHVTATGIDKQYDGTMAATVTLADDHLSGDAVTDAYTSAAFSDKSVGTGKTVTVTGIAISGADAPNYALASTTATTTASITLRALTVTAAASDKIYDGTTTGTVTLNDNRVTGDVLTDSSTSATFVDKNVGIGKTVTVNGISISGMDAGNYNLSNTSATATASITARSIIVSGVTDTKVYDATTISSGVPTITTGSLASGDTATFSQAFDNKNVGTTKALTPTGTISDGNGGANYNVTYTAAALGSITARPLTVRAATDSKIYDGGGASSGIPTITSGTLAGSDTGSFIQTFDNRNVGTGKTLTPAGTVSDGNTGANYQVTFTAVNTGSISQRPITITAVVETKVYDGTLLSSGKPGITSGSLASGDTATLSQAFSQSDAAGIVILTPAIVIADGNGGNDYAVTVQTVSGTITKAGQMITWATPSAITYGTALGSTQLNATVVGVAGGSVPGALTYTPASGTVPNPGSNQLQVAAAATNNYNAATATVQIAVKYSTAACDGDLGHTILQPINPNGLSTFKQGSTVPAKFRVCNANGNSVGTAGVVKSFNIIQTINGTPSDVTESVDSTTPDTAFRWDPTAQQWIFNISTKSMLAHTTYVFAIGLNDGSVIQFQFGLPK